MEYAFVTGATGLLGNNVVRALLKRNIKVKALVRSVESQETVRQPARGVGRRRHA